MPSPASNPNRRDFLKSSSTGLALGGVLGLGLDIRPLLAAAPRLKISASRAVPSVCPYCAVGCAQLVHVRDGRIINIEGNPDSPINRGTLCPKGAATYQLVVNPQRLTRVKYRRPGGSDWEEKPLEWAMQEIARRVKDTRDATFVESIKELGRAEGVEEVEQSETPSGLRSRCVDRMCGSSFNCFNCSTPSRTVPPGTAK